MKYRIETARGEVTFEFFKYEDGSDEYGYYEIRRATDEESEGEWITDIVAFPNMRMSELREMIEEKLDEMGYQQ